MLTATGYAGSMQWLDQVLDLVFPPRCVGCRTRGVLLCARCRVGCEPVSPATNQRSHQQLGSTALASTTGAYRFHGAVREAIHALKYDRRARVATVLGDLLAAYVVEHPLAVDVIVPVPLHAARLRERGFNQSALLAQQLATQLKLPMSTQLVARARNNATG